MSDDKRTITGWVMTEVGKPVEKRELSIDPPKAGEVLVEVAGCGVCHTDLSFFYFGVPTVNKPPMTLGRWLGSRSSAAPAPTDRARPSGETEKRTEAESDANDLAATGIGRRVDHRVRRVPLDLEDRPAAQLRLRYEYRQQLVHLGVLPSPEEEEALARRERASGFSDFSFAPDPFSHGR